MFSIRTLMFLNFFLNVPCLGKESSITGNYDVTNQNYFQNRQNTNVELQHRISAPITNVFERRSLDFKSNNFNKLNHEKNTEDWIPIIKQTTRLPYVIPVPAVSNKVSSPINNTENFENIVNSSDSRSNSQVKINDEFKIEKQNFINNKSNENEKSEKPWYIDLLSDLRLLLMECKQLKSQNVDESKKEKGKFSLWKDCLRYSILKTLDNAEKSDTFYLSSYVTLVKEKNITDDVLSDETRSSKEDFFTELIRAVNRLLSTHSFKVNLSPSFENVEEGRKRQHYRKAFPMMVAGYMMMSAFLVPLGFQFMAMLGGKALLLSKMAFMMSMYMGYKKLFNEIELHHHHPELELFQHAFHHRAHRQNPMTLAFAGGKGKHSFIPLRKIYTIDK